MRKEKDEKPNAIHVIADKIVQFIDQTYQTHCANRISLKKENELLNRTINLFDSGQNVKRDGR